MARVYLPAIAAAAALIRLRRQAGWLKLPVALIQVTHRRRYDRRPLSGRSARHAHRWLAAGHGMLGISMSSGSQQFMTDLITGQAPAIASGSIRAECFR